jgi:hypothetical protein
VTARVLKALEHPAVCAMGHPSARIIGTRPPVQLDFERVFERAAALGVAMEINAQPDRMDLSDVNARLAKARGVRFVIDTDAHSAAQLDHMRFGVFNARRAGLTREDVLNTQPLERLRKSLHVAAPARTRAAATQAAGGAAGKPAGPKSSSGAGAKPPPTKRPAAAARPAEKRRPAKKGARKP